MLKLFTLADPRVAAVPVKGDLIVDERNRDRIMTRSRTRDAPDRYTQVPFPVKALKLLLKDVQGLQGGKGKKGPGAGAGGVEGVDEDDGVSLCAIRHCAVIEPSRGEDDGALTKQDAEWDDDEDDFGGSEVGEFDYLSCKSPPSQYARLRGIRGG